MITKRKENQQKNNQASAQGKLFESPIEISLIKRVFWGISRESYGCIYHKECISFLPREMTWKTFFFYLVNNL